MYAHNLKLLNDTQFVVYVYVCTWKCIHQMDDEYGM